MQAEMLSTVKITSQDSVDTLKQRISATFNTG